jgi:hypothetical protein
LNPFIFYAGMSSGKSGEETQGGSSAARCEPNLTFGCLIIQKDENIVIIIDIPTYAVRTK